MCLYETNGSNKITGFMLNEFAIIDKGHRAILKTANYLHPFKYAGDIPDFKNMDEYVEYFLANEEQFKEGIVPNIDDTKLKEERKEMLDEKKAVKEQEFDKALKVLDENIEDIFYREGVTNVVAREGLNPREAKILRKLASKYERYNVDKHLLVNIERNPKYKERLLYQSLKINKDSILEDEKIASMVKKNYRAGRKKPKFNYETPKGRKFRTIFNAIWEYDEDGIITKKRTDWKDIPASEKAGLKEMFYIEIDKTK